MAYSQDQADTAKRRIVVNLEIRPRAEFRDNHVIPPDTTMPDFHISQRNRVSLTYQSKRLKVHGSFQEIHLWFKQHTTSSVGSVNAYELYVEPEITKRLSARIGRQGILLDNGRMFSDAPWSQQSRSHEGVRLMYTTPTFSSDLIALFTRDYSDRFESAYSPVASHRYKYLFIHHGKSDLNNSLSITSLSAAEVFESSTLSKKEFIRATAGGRIEYERKKFYWTVCAFYQFGEDGNSRWINAFYIQPELRYTISPDLSFRLGSEILSGGGPASDPGNTRSFVPLYGVAWKFMGNMNLFTRFPNDVRDRGLINPYLFVLYEINKSISLRSDYHLFFSQHELQKVNEPRLNRFLGFENDISVRYRPAKIVQISFGFSYVLATRSMEYLDKVKDYRDIPVWSYLMISFQPALFSAFSGKEK